MPEKAASTQQQPEPEAAYREEMDKLKEDIGKLQSDVSELVGLLKASAEEKGADVKGKASKEAEHLLEELMAKVDEGVSRGKKTVDDVGEQIGEHPVSTLFITFGLGYILAKLTERSGGNPGKSN